MRERPILFSAPMVRAILEGRKTQTRRAIRKQFAPDAEPAEVAATSPEGWQISGHSGLWWDDAGACIDDAIRCPYGQPGYRLWVRETHMLGLESDIEVGAVAYKADGYVRGGLGDFEGRNWRPSIHMPRWASRINLEIVAVRVERLQDISKEDAIAEGLLSYCGAEQWWGTGLDGEGINGCRFLSPIECYRALWDALNGPGSWDANPWVWVVEFKRVTP